MGIFNNKNFAQDLRANIQQKTETQRLKDQ
jgi:hypothetical protein